MSIKFNGTECTPKEFVRKILEPQLERLTYWHEYSEGGSKDLTQSEYEEVIAHLVKYVDRFKSIIQEDCGE